MAETEQETLKSQLPAVESFICKFLLSIGGQWAIGYKNSKHCLGEAGTLVE